MSDERQRARNLLLDKGTSKQARKSVEITVYVGDDPLDLEVRQLAIAEARDISTPEKVRDEIDGEPDNQLLLIARCTYIPGTDEQPLNDAEGMIRLHEAPYGTDGWVAKLSQAANYVHGYRTDTPEGVEDPRLIEIADAADQLQAIAEQQSELDTGQVAEIGERIATWARYMDQGGDHEGNPMTR